MQAIILAAGQGNRLREVTQGKPKCYVELAGESLLGRNLRLLREAGVRRTVIVTGYQRRQLMADFSAPDIVWAFNPFYAQANVLASFWAGMSRLEAGRDVLYLHADTVFHPKILQDLMERPGALVLACDEKVCGDEEMKYRSEGGRVVEINKTMETGASEGEFLGVCKIAGGQLPAVREAVEAVLERGIFEAFFEVAIQELIDSRRVPVTVMPVGEHPWIEIDFPEDYAAAQELFAAPGSGKNAGGGA